MIVKSVMATCRRIMAASPANANHSPPFGLQPRAHRKSAIPASAKTGMKYLH
jgi:hypothetical protein